MKTVRKIVIEDVGDGVTTIGQVDGKFEDILNFLTQAYTAIEQLAENTVRKMVPDELVDVTLNVCKKLSREYLKKRDEKGQSAATTSRTEEEQQCDEDEKPTSRVFDVEGQE